MGTCLLEESKTVRIDILTPDGPKQVRLQPKLWELLSRMKRIDEAWPAFFIHLALKCYLAEPSFAFDVETVHWRSGQLAGYISDKVTGRTWNDHGWNGVERRRKWQSE
jgi:hypothetical protein